MLYRGRLVEEGAHSELLAPQGLYVRLHRALAARLQPDALGSAS